MRESRGLLVAAVALVMLLAAGVLAACGSDDEASAVASPSGDVVAVVNSEEQLSQFSQALDGAGLDGEGPYTVFAPSDTAVSAAAVTLDGDVVKASAVDGENLTEADMAEGTKNDSMLEDNTIVTYTGTDGALYVNDHKVVDGPLDADNGVVYIIDGVIQPKE